jgi:predicted nucleic acid-binding protein
MTTAIDTNVIVGLWNAEPVTNARARIALDAALELGSLVIAAPVYSELLAAPGRDEAFLDAFFQRTGIRIDWQFEAALWRVAGKAFQQYATRRKKQKDAGPRRILADFLIGSHALTRGFRLLTFDDGFYGPAFPSLRLIRG